MSAGTASPSGGSAAARLAALWSRHRNILITFALIFAVWEIAVHVFRAPRYILPAPTAVWEGFLSQPARMLANTWATTQIIVVGYAIAVVVSIPLALLIAFSRFVQTTLYPLLVVFQIIPKIAVAPLFIVWFGFGFMPKVMLVFLLSFFPIVISAIAGFRSLDADVEDFARSTGAGAWRMFFKIRLPQSLPSIFTGLKVGAAMAATAAVVAEFVGSDSGLGYLILEYNGFIETAKVFAAIILLSLAGLAIYYLVEAVERLAIPWHVSQKTDDAAGLR
ncbi:MAG: ABC transporter permease [Betaproteobacteria bacterium PRO3]|nr:ABC transporter permease [Betaproteobacteria bacterium PRO3]